MEVAAKIFEAFKDATLKLEASKTPTSHIAGRVMLWLLYKVQAHVDKPGVVGCVCVVFFIYILYV